MTTKEIEMFKTLFSKYCRGMVNKGNCDDGDCEFCAINTAYDTIFYSLNEEEDD